MFRAAQVKATGQWMAALIQSGGFADDGQAYANALAVEFGLPVGSLVVHDDPVDPRTGKLMQHPPLPVADPGLPDKRLALKSTLNAATTVGDVKAALLAWLG